MSENIWYHALQFLDKFRTESVQDDASSEFYKLNDDTGILERHRKRLEQAFNEKEIDVKDLYSELIKMILDYESKEWPEGIKITLNNC